MRRSTPRNQSPAAQSASEPIHTMPKLAETEEQKRRRLRGGVGQELVTPQHSGSRLGASGTTTTNQRTLGVK